MKWLKDTFKKIRQSRIYKEVMDARRNIIYIVTIGTLIIIDTFVYELSFWIYILAIAGASFADKILNYDPTDDDDDDDTGHFVTDGS